MLVKLRFSVFFGSTKSFYDGIQNLITTRTITQNLQSLVVMLMKSYEENAHVQPNFRKGGYCIIIREIKPKYSKSIIDQMDNIFADYFGFTSKEKEFIKTFDLKFRIEEE